MWASFWDKRVLLPISPVNKYLSQPGFVAITKHLLYFSSLQALDDKFLNITLHDTSTCNHRNRILRKLGYFYETLCANQGHPELQGWRSKS